MQITTKGNFVSLEQLKEQKVKLKRIAFGIVKARTAYEQLANVTVLGAQRFSFGSGTYYYGTCNNNKRFVFEEESECASSLYVEQ